MEDIAISVDGPTVDPTDAEEWKRTAAHWSITLERDRRKFETDYWTGSGLVTYEPTRIEPGTHRDHKLRAEGKRIVMNHYGPGRDAIASPRPPTLPGVLYSLQSDVRAGDDSFENFCGDFGYDTDSRKAYATWETCRDTYFELRDFFGGDFDEFLNTDWEEMECSSN